MAQPPPCPYCGAHSYRLRDTRWLVCQECDHEIDLEHELCQRCGHLNRAGVTACAHCGTPLQERAINRLIADRSKDRIAWQNERVAIAVDQKKEEKEASQRRMEAYWADDRARRQAQAHARAEQRKRERKMLIAVGIVIVVLAGIVLRVSHTPRPSQEIALAVAKTVYSNNARAFQGLRCGGCGAGLREHGSVRAPARAR